MKPICVPCERFMRPKKLGYYFLEGMPTHAHDGSQGKHSAGWAPYKLWAGDLYHCPDCGAQTIVGTGRAPISEHYLDDFPRLVDELGAARLLVKDC
jgi:hypothetical protein